MTRDLGLWARTYWIVGRVAEVNGMSTLDASWVGDFILLDGDVKVSPHQDLRGGIDVF